MRYFLRIFMALLLCVLLPCTVVTLVVGHNSAQLYEDTIAGTQQRRLEMVSNTNRLVLDNIERDAVRLASETPLSGLGEFQTLRSIVLNRTKMSQLHRINQALESYVRTSDLFASVYLYMDGTDYVISSDEGVLQLERFADLTWMEDCRALRGDPEHLRLLPSHQIQSSYPSFAQDEVKGYGRPCLTYLCPVTPYTSSLWGTLVFNIYEDRLHELYAADTGGGAVAIFTEEGALLSSTFGDLQQAAFESQDWANLREDDYRVVHTQEGDRWLLTLHRAPSEGLCYVSMEDMSLLGRRQTAFQLTLTAVVALLLVAGSLMAFVISRRLYNPVLRLYREVGASGRIEPDAEPDEVSALARAFQEMLREERRLLGDGGKEKLREATFRRILAGQSDPEDPDYAQVLPHGNAVCVLAQPDPPENAEDAAPDEGEPRARLLVHMCCEALSAAGLACSGIQDAGRTGILLVSADDAGDALRERLMGALRSVQAEFLAAFGYPVTFAVGSAGGRDQVPRSLERARQMMTYRFIRGYGHILVYDALEEEPATFAVGDRLRWIRLDLEQGKRDRLEEAVRGLLDEMAAQEDISYANVMQVLGRLSTELAQYTDSARIPLGELFGDEGVIYRQFWNRRTLGEVRDWMLEVCGRIIDYQSANSGNTKYIRQAREYARTHFGEGITVDTIAQELGISYSYLRRIYKESTGQNLTDYLAQLRLENAKKYLRETSLTVREIAQKCGYSYERSFSRAFIGAEGVSPGRYREMARGEERREE